MEELSRSERKKEDMNNPPRDPSSQKLLNEIRRIIVDRKSQCLPFENVDPEVGSLIVDSLNEDAVVESLRPRY